VTGISKSSVSVNAGEKMHRRAGVKMHHGHLVRATSNSTFRLNDESALLP
jgi:hypothetical protein